MSQTYIPLHIYLNPERDTAILAWLEGQKNKSAAVREALEVYLQTGNVSRVGMTQATLDPTALYQTLDQALKEHLDWGYLRQIVEVAVRHAMAGLPPVPTSMAEEESDDLLCSLDSSLEVE